LTPVGWLTQNGPYLLILIALGVWLYRSYGFHGLIQASLAILGLGFIIFIHELGHFLTAKWCDVHVQTFSIGFGPALPGCSFQRGETTYKIAILPLGGYVNMVGEGPEADEDENYPRSFKNKTVGQRMLIISAGVIMNVLFGALAFVVVYRYHGVERPPAIVWRTEPGGPAWTEGVQPGWAITHIDDKSRPWFEDMKVAVALSREGQEINFGFKTREGEDKNLTLVPRRDENDVMPVIGVTPPPRLRLLPASVARTRELPVAFNSPAAAARELDLRPGDVVVAATDDANGKVTSLPTGKAGWQELSKRLMALRGKDMVLRVQRAGAKAGAVQTVEVPASGFAFGDSIVGTTDPDTPDEPFRVKELPVDPNHTDEAHDPFEFRRRLVLLAGKPMVVQVRRHGASDTSGPVSILVPPAFHVTFGVRMKMGEIAGVRNNSPAAEAGVRKGDEIVTVKLRYGKEDVPLSPEALDPVRLPYELAKRIYHDKERPDMRKWRVLLTVKGGAERDQSKERLLEPMRWDETWRFARETPVSAAAPMSIPELGLAYRVTSRVAEVKPGSPAAEIGVKEHDVISEVRLRKPGKKLDDKVSWSHWIKIASKREANPEVFDQWANFFWGIQRGDYQEVEVKVRRAGSDDDVVLGKMEGQPDRTWPLTSRGLVLANDTRLQKATSLTEALVFGWDRTLGFIKQIYLNLSSLLSGRISARTLGGPIEIASQAFSVAGEDPFLFLLFLGIISINLAVVNFLPIPILDGGHMVFLIYEKLRGRPPSEAVRAVATYIGLALILALMVFVFYLDIKRRFFGGM
jgi:regulator of sigma E protease